MFQKCKGQHWSVKNNQLILDTPEGKDIALQVIKVLDAQIRNQIAKEIMAWKPAQNRTEIMKRSGSIDNALLGVQAICADIALGNRNAS